MIALDPIKILPNKESTDVEWIQWHEACKRRFGKKVANNLFMRAWVKRSEKGDWLSSGKANTENLRDYLSDNGIEIEKGAADYAVSWVDNTEEFFSSAFNIGKKASFVAAGLLIIIILAVVYVLVKNPQLAKQAGLAYATGGAIK